MLKKAQVKRGWFQYSNPERPDHSLSGVPMYVDEVADGFVMALHPSEPKYVRIDRDLFEGRFIPSPK